MKRKNIVGALSIGAILGGLVSAGIPVDAKADIEAYIVKVDEDIYSYNKYELTEDFLNFKAGNAAELYKDFTVKLKIGNGFHAFKDGKKGFINYKDIENNYLDAKTEHKTFSVDKYVESKECKVIEVTWTKKAVITKEGQIKYETPLNNDSDNKNKDTENKENDNKESNKENGNKSVDSKDAISSDNKTSENNTSSNNKPKQRYKSSSGVKENKEEKKSDVVQKDDKKDQEDKQKQEQEQLKKEQEAKAEQAEKEKQEQQAKEEAERIEKAKQAEAERQKAEELKKQEELRKQKEEEAKQKQEQLKKEEAEKEKQEKLAKEAQEKAKQEQFKKEQEDKARAEQAEKERQAKIEAEKKKAEQQRKEAEAKAKAEKEKQEQQAKEEAERQKAEELKKQEELRKQKQEQLKKEEVEKEKQAKLAKEAQEKAKQEQLKKEQEDNAKAEQAEKERQAKIEAEKKKAEQQRKEAEAKAKAEKEKQEQQAREEAERIEKAKQVEAERQKTEELKKQEELRKQKEEDAKQKQEQLKKEQEDKARAEQAQKERQAKIEAEKKKAEQQRKEAEAKAKAEKEQQAKEAQLKKEQQNNRLIEEAKNNINLGDLTNVKNNLALPTKDTNGVQIAWKSSDESVIKNDGTVTRPSSDKGDKKVTLTATFTKDSITSNKDFEAIVKAEEKAESNPNKDTMDKEISIDALKKDSEGNYIANNPEEFYCVVKDGLSKIQPSVVINLPNYKFGPKDSKGYSTADPKYNLGIINEILIKYAEIDYGKPHSESSIQGNGCTNKMTITFDYRRDINEVKRQKDATEAAVKKIITEVIKPGMTDVEKELALHDYVVKHADYNTEGLKKNPADLEDHSAYGVLVLGKGVCESYAKAMHLLLNEVGIECKYATGYKKYENGTQGGGHAWNMVKLDNEWYNLDATWDDPISDRVGKSDKEVVVSPVIHTYFNITDAVFNKDHIRGAFEEKNYPAANGTKYSYDNLDVDEFMNDGTKVPSVSSREELIEKVKEAMKNRETTLYVRLKGFKMTQQELMNELGKVLDGNIYESYGVSPTDQSHAYCNFVLR